MSDINEVRYPQQFDTPLNFPSVTEVTESTGEDINRNRDAIITLERVLGLNPHIGLYTDNPATATVNERLDIIENGIAEGRFAFRDLNVNNVLIVNTDIVGNATVDLGGDPQQTSVAPVNVRGPFRILDSGLTNNQAISDVPIVVNARGNLITAGSFPGEPLLRITDTNADLNQTDRNALVIDGNVLIQNGRLTADFAISHNQLLDVTTTPTTSQPAFHVTGGDFHSHRRKRDPVTGALLNEVDPVASDTNGLINHVDLLGIFTKAGQTDFVPVEGVAYHVTGGDDHDHKDGRGAQIDHLSLKNIDPATSNHVTGGDRHSHGPNGDGAPIDHFDLLNNGFLSHAEIDQKLNVEFPEHITLIDPTNAADINEADRGSAAHVPLGHVSDPDAHHTRYTDEEAINSQVLVSGITQNYNEGQNTTIQGHIQATGSGTVSNRNPHGLSAPDIGALEGFDAQGNVPDFTRQFLQVAIQDVLPEAVIVELQSVLDTKEDVLSASNPVLTSQLADFAVTTDKLANSAVTNVKKQEPYSLMPLTATVNVPTAPAGTAIHGFKVPADVTGEIYDISVMWHQNSAGGLGTTVDVLYGADSGTPSSIIGGPQNIHAPTSGLFAADTPGRITPTTTAVSGANTGDDIVVNVGHTGVGNYDVTVTVWLKVEHVA